MSMKSFIFISFVFICTFRKSYYVHNAMGNESVEGAISYILKHLRVIFQKRWDVSYLIFKIKLITQPQSLKKKWYT